MEVNEFIGKRVKWFEDDVNSLIKSVKNGDDELVELYRKTITQNFINVVSDLYY